MPPCALPAATRESAFVHAIASAGVAFAVTRSCAEGTSTICGCDSHHKGPPGEGWKWGGCSEDADFGVLVSREFADARENRPDARSAMNKHNNEAGRTVSPGHPPTGLPETPSGTCPHPSLWPMCMLGSLLAFLLLSPWTVPQRPAYSCPEDVVSPRVWQSQGAGTKQPILSTVAACVAVRPVGLALNSASILS